MPAIMEIQKDRHQSAYQYRNANAKAEADAKIAPKGRRRPTRGTQLHRDTIATLEVITGGGRKMNLFDGGGSTEVQAEEGTAGRINVGVSQTYSNFMLQSISEERMEKQQILETFGEPYIFFFGERPRVMSFQGVLLNTYDFNWEAEWWANYDTILRGTRCVENDARIYLTFDQTVVSGYVLSTSSQKSSTERNHVPFNFQLYVTSWASLTSIGATKVNSWANETGAQQFKSSYTSELLANGPGSDKLKNGTLEPGVALKLKDDGSFGKVEEGLAAANRASVNAVKTIDSYISKGIRTVANIFSGDTVRMPAGFAGALAWGEISKLNDPAVSYELDRPITYTHFRDNDDEFVNPGPPTTESEAKLDAVKFLNNGLFAAERKWDTPQAKAILAKVGAKPALVDGGAWSTGLGPLTASLLSETLGMGKTVFALAAPEAFAKMNSALSLTTLVIRQAVPPSSLSGLAVAGAGLASGRPPQFGFGTPT